MHILSHTTDRLIVEITHTEVASIGSSLYLSPNTLSTTIPLTPGDYHAPANPWHPRTAPRPTDQISGELKEPALSAWLGIDPYIDPTTDETLDIPFTPVAPPASDTTNIEPTEPSS